MELVLKQLSWIESVLKNIKPYKVWFGVLLFALLFGAHIPLLQEGRWQTDDGLSTTPLIALLFGLYHWFQSDSRPLDTKDLIFISSISLLFLLPSQQWGWLILGATFFFLYLRETPLNKSILMACTVVVGFNLSMHFFFNRYVGDVLAFDAYLITHILQWTHGVGHQVGNLVYGPADHQLLILRGCSSIHNLGGVWLVWFMVKQVSQGQHDGKSHQQLFLDYSLWFAIVSFLTISWNMVRLYMMALDRDYHAWWHTGDGTVVYQIGLFVILALLIRSVRYGVAK
jgi:hypothetical protein